MMKIKTQVVQASFSLMKEQTLSHVDTKEKNKSGLSTHASRMRIYKYDNIWYQQQTQLTPNKKNK